MTHVCLIKIELSPVVKSSYFDNFFTILFAHFDMAERSFSVSFFSGIFSRKRSGGIEPFSNTF